MKSLSFLSFTLFYASALALPTSSSRRQNTNDGIHLAITPTCGTLTGSTPANVNAGLKPFSSFKDIVAFGDSFTSGGTSNGSALPPAILIPPNPQAGGRLTNGPLWIEDIASDAGATLLDYAVADAVTDHTLWPSTAAVGTNDLVGQMNTFISQEQSLSPASTLYVIFMGQNDYTAALESNYTSRLQDAADTIAYQTLVLSSGPVFAKNFLILDNTGLATSTSESQQYKATVFSMLNAMYNKLELNVGFVDFTELWDGVMNGTPGYQAFGYTSDGACLSSSTSMTGACADPEHTFDWIPGQPSKETHRLMASFVEEAMTNCVVEPPLS